MVRDLVENAIQIVEKQQYSRVYAQALKGQSTFSQSISAWN